MAAGPIRPDGEGLGVGKSFTWLRDKLWLIVRHKMFLLMLGGAVGTWLRYWVGRWFALQPWGQVFPFGTLVINVSGSFILGTAAALILGRFQEDWYLLIGTGFCGGYTTFSTFELETFNLVRNGSWGLALANVVGSVVAGFLGVLLAVVLVGLLFPKP
jgi:CrcB protein